MNYNYELKETAPNQRVFEFEIPQKEFDRKINKIYNEVRKNIHFPGFRKGKVPVAVLKKRLGNEVKTEAINELIEDAIREVIFGESKLMIVSTPEVTDVVVNDDQPMKFSVSVEVVPEFEIPPFDSMTIEVPLYHEDSIVEDMLNRMREDIGEMVPLEDDEGALEEDEMVIRYILKDGEGNVIEEKEEYEFILGSGDVHPEFDKQLIGAKINDTKTVEITYDEDYESEELQGKTFHFDIEVLDIKRFELPELDDTFARTVSQHDTLEDLKKELYDQALRIQESYKRQFIKTHVLGKLVKEVEVKLPEKMLAEYTQTVKERWENIFLRDENITDEEKEDILENVSKAHALRQLKEYFVYGEITKREGIKVTDREVDTILEEEALSQNQDPQKYIKKLRKEGDQIRQLEDIILEEKIVDLLMDKADIQLKKISTKEEHDEFMKNFLDSPISISAEEETQDTTSSTPETIEPSPEKEVTA
ncbi:MAG: trigger factor [Gemmatimonadetes bacterium]|nr:MAG: trigger factor [Gemmatimonadota bacterium]